ncbi:DUF6894 family protein [Sphingopyxis sp.]|uniref:DUF6894 family protein n=1 Tax=Sphingopyxis sp. TaxID=1908224 RepID=UPI002D78C8A7|nr:hypothetical protein [Sphingopyxis sp.]HET6523167.1 hypothetical protein [Sphingopyxis sp.]
MPLYYFNVQNDLFSEDLEGLELADFAAARVHAVAGARGIAAETVIEGHLDRQHYVEILDAARRSIAKVNFGDVIEIR